MELLPPSKFGSLSNAQNVAMIQVLLELISVDGAETETEIAIEIVIEIAIIRVPSTETDGLQSLLNRNFSLDVRMSIAQCSCDKLEIGLRLQSSKIKSW
jgi:hypothetical protein